MFDSGYHTHVYPTGSKCGPFSLFSPIQSRTALLPCLFTDPCGVQGSSPLATERSPHRA
jgi:hypothetical protein